MPCLIVTEGPANGAFFALEDHNLVIVGRDEDCTFQIVDPQISRHHLQLKREKSGRHLACDFQSANGVKVNGIKITGDMPLADGDEIRIGQSCVAYSSTDYPDAQAAMLSRVGDQWKRSTIKRGND